MGLNVPPYTLMQYIIKMKSCTVDQWASLFSAHWLRYKYNTCHGDCIQVITQIYIYNMNHLGSIKIVEADTEDKGL